MRGKKVGGAPAPCYLPAVRQPLERNAGMMGRSRVATIVLVLAALVGWQRSDAWAGSCPHSGGTSRRSPIQPARTSD